MPVEDLISEVAFKETVTMTPIADSHGCAVVIFCDNQVFKAKPDEAIVHLRQRCWVDMYKHVFNDYQILGWT